jgi:hypothetical protein
MSTASPTARRWRRYGPSLVVLALFGGMAALGLWSNRPAPPRTPDDPQPLLQVYRGGQPKDLLLALPLRGGDQVRVNAEIPTGLFPRLVLVEASGVKELAPMETSRRGGLDLVAYPVMNAMQVPGPGGTKLFLLVAGRTAKPDLDDIKSLIGPTPWPVLPRYAIALLARGRVEVTGPRGPKLPAPDATRAVEDRLTELGKKLSERYAFFAGVAVPFAD